MATSSPSSLGDASIGVTYLKKEEGAPEAHLPRHRSLRSLCHGSRPFISRFLFLALTRLEAVPPEGFFHVVKALGGNCKRQVQLQGKSRKLSKEDTMKNLEMKVTATRVKERKRTFFLFDLCNGEVEALHFEHLVYAWMGKLSAYTGGYWHFYKLSNGGGYMALAQEDTVTINSTNGFSFEMSPDAAGIVVTLFAMSHASETFQGEARDRMVDQYHNLLDYIEFHPEAAKIYGAID